MVCSECGFVARSAGGLGSHRRARHGVVRVVSVAAAAELEDEAGILRALLRRLAGAVDVAEPRELAALAKQLASVAAALAKVGPKDGSLVDELGARRAARLADAADQ